MPFFIVNNKITSKRGLNYHCTLHFKTLNNNDNNNNNKIPSIWQTWDWTSTYNTVSSYRKFVVTAPICELDNYSEEYSTWI